MTLERFRPAEMQALARFARGLDVSDDTDLGEIAQRVVGRVREQNGAASVETIESALRLEPTIDYDFTIRGLLAADGKIDSAGPIGDVVPAETNFIFRTAREIAQATPERPEWIVHGLAAKGAITELDAKIKAGKTEFVARLIKAILTGDDFLERPTRQTPVVYLTEQSATSFREPLRRAGLLEADDLVVLSWADTIKHRWEVVAAAAIAKCSEIGAQMLVVDTLGAFARLNGDDENSSGKAAEAMAPLQLAAARGLAVVVLRHDRKSGGDVGESARGSSAFGGAADIILALRRGEGNSRPTIRALHGLSRFDETPTTLMIELTATGYVALGTEGAVAAKEARIALLDSAPQTAEHAMTEQELMDFAKVRRSTGRPALAELVANGALQCTLAEGEKGKKGNPARYWRQSGPRILSVESPVVPSETITGAPAAGGRASAPAPGILSAGTSPLRATAIPAETISSAEVDGGDESEKALPWQ